MSWQLHEIMIPLFAGALVMMVIVLVTLRRRTTPGAWPFALLSLSLSIYTLGYAGELGSSSASDVLTWLKIEYVGVAFLRPFMFLTVLDFCGHRRYFSPATLLALFALPVMIVGLAWTAEYHDWLWQDLHLVRYGDVYYAEFSTGIAYQINVVYTMALIAVSVVVLIRAHRRATDGVYRRQITAILVGVLIPLSVYIVYTLDVMAAPLDLNPFALTIAAIVMAWALFRQQLFDVAPIAREVLLSGMRDAVIVVDTKDRVVEMNTVARTALNVTTQQIAGQPMAAVFLAWPHLVEQYRHVYDTREEITIDLNQRLHTYDLGITALRDPSGKLRGRLIILTDITARVTAENALKENYARIMTLYQERARLVDELEAFAHTVAHDLKNPLHSIIGYVGLLHEELLTQPSALELAKQIEKITYSSVGIINDLLLLAKVRNTQDIELKPLAMHVIVQDAIDQLAPQIQQHRAVIELPDRWEAAQGYAPWVEAIWINYISNAIKYGGTPPHIKLGSSLMPDQTVCFWIEDNGRGLTDDEKAKLFQPFTRLATVRIDGHGLGLSIVQRIAERLEGKVGVASTINKGSRFYFTLPTLPQPTLIEPAVL